MTDAGELKPVGWIFERKYPSQEWMVMVNRNHPDTITVPAGTKTKNVCPLVKSSRPATDNAPAVSEAMVPAQVANALDDYNDIIRSFNAVAERKGHETNWQNLHARAQKVLNEHHSTWLEFSSFRERLSAHLEAVLSQPTRTEAEASADRGDLGDLPSRIMGWVNRARRDGLDTIELDLTTADRILSALRNHEGPRTEAARDALMQISKLACYGIDLGEKQGARKWADSLSEIGAIADKTFRDLKQKDTDA